MDQVLKDILIILASLFGVGGVGGSVIGYSKSKKENQKRKQEVEKIRNDMVIQNNQVNELKLTMIQINNKLDIITNNINLMINTNNTNEININKTITKNNKKVDGENNNERY